MGMRWECDACLKCEVFHFQFRGKPRGANRKRLPNIIHTNFSKITVPFDSATEFPEIWVEWIAPFKIL